MLLFDAHNHLQDERFAGRQDELVSAARSAGVAGMVVNGSCEADWPAVLELAQRHPGFVVPSFGYHPWYLGERTPHWRERLVEMLEATPSAVGEIGLDRWKPQLPYEDQEEVFLAHMQIAAERNLPVSIHCLQAWGRLVERLERGPRPACGFLLHSFGGSLEIAERLVPLGAYFSLPGYYAHERKVRQREVFRQLPPDRVLIETDAPDQLPPASRILYPCTDAAGALLHHPANLRAIHAFAAELFGESETALARRMAINFTNLFGARSTPR